MQSKFELHVVNIKYPLAIRNMAIGILILSRADLVTIPIDKLDIGGTILDCIIWAVVDTY